MFETVLLQSLWMAMLFSAIPLMCSMFVGLVAGVLQAATQIQEQSISFFLKLMSVSCILYIAGPFALRQLVLFFKNLLESYPLLGRM